MLQAVRRCRRWASAHRFHNTGEQSKEKKRCLVCFTWFHSIRSHRCTISGIVSPQFWGFEAIFEAQRLNFPILNNFICTIYCTQNDCLDPMNSMQKSVWKQTNAQGAEIFAKMFLNTKPQPHFAFYFILICNFLWFVRKLGHHLEDNSFAANLSGLPVILINWTCSTLEFQYQPSGEGGWTPPNY